MLEPQRQTQTTRARLSSFLAPCGRVVHAGSLYRACRHQLPSALKYHVCQATPCHIVPISMTKRYFTSDPTVRSKAKLIWSALMISWGQVIPCWLQKSNMSCVSLMPPNMDAESILRPEIRSKAWKLRNFGGMPSTMHLPSGQLRQYRAEGHGQQRWC